jgi:uncharacterized membrane protein
MVFQPHPAAFHAFFVVWMILIISNAVFFHGNKNVALKRRFLPVTAFGVGILFIGFTTYLTGKISPIMIIAVTVIIILNVKGTKICDACGKTNHGRNPFVPQKHCTNCGAPLK